MPGAEVAAWDDARTQGPYEGEYQDADYIQQHEQALVSQKSMREIYRREAGSQYSAELGWAINLVEVLDVQLAKAESDDERQAIFNAHHMTLSDNQALLVKARDYINDKKAEQFMQVMQTATDALANGNMRAYLEAEAALQQTSPIDTEAVRARVAAAYDTTNER